MFSITFRTDTITEDQCLAEMAKGGDIEKLIDFGSGRTVSVKITKHEYRCEAPRPYFYLVSWKDHITGDSLSTSVAESDDYGRNVVREFFKFIKEMKTKYIDLL